MSGHRASFPSRLIPVGEGFDVREEVLWGIYREKRLLIPPLQPLVLFDREEGIAPGRRWWQALTRPSIALSIGSAVVLLMAGLLAPPLPTPCP